MDVWVRLLLFPTLWLTLTGGELAVHYTLVFIKQRLSGGVIHISPPCCRGVLGSGIPANLGPVVQRD